MEGQQISATTNKSTGMTGIQKVIIIVLGHILIIVMLLVVWDLYGKSALCVSSNSNITQQTPSPSAKAKDNNVDSSLYSSCTSKISDEKTYKDCCDALSVDDDVKKACKKVVDDSRQDTPVPTK